MNFRPKGPTGQGISALDFEDPSGKQIAACVPVLGRLDDCRSLIGTVTRPWGRSHHGLFHHPIAERIAPLTALAPGLSKFILFQPGSRAGFSKNLGKIGAPCGESSTEAI
jgi:hypothetical protein